jgi:hypothetical protein
MKMLRTFIVPLFLIFSGCAHHYYYVPETTGEGVIHSHGGIIYSVPPTHPKFKMKLTSLGVKDGMLGIRMYIVRKAGSAPSKDPSSDFMDPKEQILVLPDVDEKILPSKVHANTERKPLIALTSGKKQAVELYFPLPNKDNKGRDFQSFTLSWSLHYGKGFETQVSRFDRQDTRPEQGAEVFPADSDYPYDESPVLPPGWVEGWDYWGL